MPDGAHASDEELNKMDWYVPGVQAEAPTAGRRRGP